MPAAGVVNAPDPKRAEVEGRRNRRLRDWLDVWKRVVIAEVLTLLDGRLGDR